MDNTDCCVLDFEATLATAAVSHFDTSLTMQEWQKRFASVSDTPSLLQTVLEFERVLAVLGQGLPEGADDDTLAAMVAEAEVYEAEFVLPVSVDQLAAGGWGSMMVEVVKAVGVVEADVYQAECGLSVSLDQLATGGRGPMVIEVVEAVILLTVSVDQPAAGGWGCGST